VAVGDKNSLGGQRKFARIWIRRVSKKKGLHQKLQPMFKNDSSIIRREARISSWGANSGVWGRSPSHRKPMVV